MTRPTMSKSERSPALRLPKAAKVAKGVRQVDKADRSWSDFFLNGPRVSEDFMTDREQPIPEEREPL